MTLKLCTSYALPSIQYTGYICYLKQASYKEITNCVILSFITRILVASDKADDSEGSDESVIYYRHTSTSRSLQELSPLHVIP